MLSLFLSNSANVFETKNVSLSIDVRRGLGFIFCRHAACVRCLPDSAFEPCAAILGKARQHRARAR